MALVLKTEVLASLFPSDHQSAGLCFVVMTEKLRGSEGRTHQIFFFSKCSIITVIVLHLKSNLNISTEIFSKMHYQN